MNPFTSQRRLSVAALGEQSLIDAIREWLGGVTPRSPFGIGDDCAVVPGSRRQQLVTVDPVIFNRHFDASISPENVGAKLLKRNLSDIAAMGGRPRAAVVALSLDPRTKIRWVEGFYRGLADVARVHRVAIIGGDVAQADGTVAASLTLLGEATGRRVLTRRGARVGDAIYVTGELGNTLASGHHIDFIPRLNAGAWLASQPEVRSMMDVSDGLAKDLRALTPTGAVAALEPTAIPLRAGATLTAAVSEGEDYELLFTVSARSAGAPFERKWRRRFPRLRLSRIGRFFPANGVPPGALTLETLHGYEHLR